MRAERALELTEALDNGEVAKAVKAHAACSTRRSHPFQLLATLHKHYASMLRLDGSGITIRPRRFGARNASVPARKVFTQGQGSHSPHRRAVSLVAMPTTIFAECWLADELVIEVLVARLASSRTPHALARRRTPPGSYAMTGEPGRYEKSELLELAQEVAEAAGRVLRAGLERVAGGILLATGASRSRARPICDEVDRNSEELIVSALLRARPDDGVLGEEGSSVLVPPASPGSSIARRNDQLLYGIEEFSVSIGARVDGRSIVGAVHNR